MGQYTANGYIYKPSYGEAGESTVDLLNESYDRIDSAMAGAWVDFNDFGGHSLKEIVTAIGSTPTVLTCPTDIVPIDENTTVPANIYLRAPLGTVFDVDNGCKLTIQGELEAGRYLAFTWTGTGAIDLSYSPTVEIPIEWFGAETGIGNDCSAAFAKVDNCIGNHQDVTLGPGIYRIASAQAWTAAGGANAYGYAGFGLVGANPGESFIYCDTAGSATLTIGTAGTSWWNWRLKNLDFIGPAACCTYALVCERLEHPVLENINFMVGATQYCLDMKGCEHDDCVITVGNNADYIASLIVESAPANGLKYETSGGWGGTLHKLDYRQSHFVPTGYGLYCDGISSLDMNGVIEGNVNYVIYLNGVTNSRFQNIHTEPNASQTSFGGMYMNNCAYIDVDNGYMGAKAGDTSLTSSQNTEIWNSHTISLKNCAFGNLTIGPECYNITLENPIISDRHGLLDFSGCADVLGGVRFRDNPVLAGGYGRTGRNMVSNHLLTRWPAATAPAGWSGTLWTQCGTGLGDTTKHIGQYCAMYNAVTAVSYPDYPLPTNELDSIRGTTVNVTCWAMAPDGQDFGAGNSAFYYGFGLTAPDWANATAYDRGQGVKAVVGGDTFTAVCVVPGTSGGSISWAGKTVGDHVTDGGVTWVLVYSGQNTQASMPLQNAQADGNWRKYVAGPVYVPTNVSAASISCSFYPLDGGGEATVYFAEPCLSIGTTGSRGLNWGRGEFPEFIQLGANRLTCGASGGEPSNPVKGDLYWITGISAGTTTVLEYYNGTSWVSIAKTP